MGQMAIKCEKETLFENRLRFVFLFILHQHQERRNGFKVLKDVKNYRTFKMFHCCACSSWLCHSSRLWLCRKFSLVNFRIDKSVTFALCSVREVFLYVWIIWCAEYESEVNFLFCSFVEWIYYDWLCLIFSFTEKFL